MSRPRHIAEAQPSESLRALLDRHAAPAWDAETAAAANGLPESVQLAANQPVEVAVWEMYRGPSK